MARLPWSSRLGSHPASVWAVKHIISPIDRVIVRTTRGRVPPLSRFAVPTLLLTTTGRRSGQPRTVPLVYLRDGDRFVVANARPAGERRNPWLLNLCASGVADVRIGRRTTAVVARKLDDAELERWWPQFVAVWPAFAAHYEATGERTGFILEPA